MLDAYEGMTWITDFKRILFPNQANILHFQLCIRPKFFLLYTERPPIYFWLLVLAAPDTGHHFE